MRWPTVKNRGCRIRALTTKTTKMKNTLTKTRSSLWDELFPFTVGEYTLPSRSSGSGNYPPHNIVETEDGNYFVELAVAGFDKDDLEIVLEKRTLTVKGKAFYATADENHYVHQGIARRDWERSFALGEGIELDGPPRLENGILTVFLKRVVPEEDLPRKIEIK